MQEMTICALLLITISMIGSSLALPLNSPLLPSYDYIVAGGGPAGLTVANRLSEDPSINVLLMEAGPADAGEPEVNIPGMIGENIGGMYDWNLSTVAQVYLDGAPRSIPQGRALGGGTILNGMLWNRGGQGDFQDWVDLGNPGWGWDDLLPYFMKSETYTPPYSDEIAEQFSIQEYEPAHGHSGPVNVSFPKFFWNSSAVLFDALNELGIPTAYDPNTGLITGASFLPLDLDPVTQERSTARKAYYDPYVERPNLHVSTGQIVTQVLFEGRPINANASTPTPNDDSVGQGASPGIPGGIFGGATTLSVSGTATVPVLRRKRSLLQTLWEEIKGLATTEPGSTIRSRQTDALRTVGVEYASDAQTARGTVSASREVIVAAGALHSPQVLMLSGIGPSAALQSLQIDVNVDLAGVGRNLQDHGRVWSWYPYNNDVYTNPTELINNDTFAGEAISQYYANRTGPFTAAAIDGVAFPALPYIVNGSTAIATAAAAQYPLQYLPSDTAGTVLSGYQWQHAMMINALQDVTRAAYELINANDGVLTVANMRPFSRGMVTLDSSSPFDPPVIDPRYLSNPIDVQVLQAALAFNQRLLSTESLSQMDPVQIFPPADATDAEIALYINDRLETEYHPSGTCSMMPIELGGVVSPDLLVYGTQNLRVVDSSIMPMLPAAHLQAVVYGVAEKAADIIKSALVNSDSKSPDSSTEGASGPSTSSAADSQPIAEPPELMTSTSQLFTLTPAPPATSTTFVTVVYTQTVYAE